MVKTNTVRCQDDWRYDSRMIHDSSKDVGSGSWIMITKTPPVEKRVAPQAFHIYWATPVMGRNKEAGKDTYGRQAVVVHTLDEVTLFPDEYSLLDDDKLQVYKSEGWFMLETRAKVNVPFNMEIIGQGRDLVEEEREVIWALMLDGLNEQQACEEYFLTKHIDANNSNIMYAPPSDVLDSLVSTFGNR